MKKSLVVVPTIKGAYTFHHGVSVWHGLTVLHAGVVDKVMFANKPAAQQWAKSLGVVDKIKWSISPNDLYAYYRKAY